MNSTQEALNELFKSAETMTDAMDLAHELAKAFFASCLVITDTDVSTALEIASGLINDEVESWNSVAP